jgi:hypothetical protein
MLPILPNITIVIVCVQETSGFILGIKHNPYRLFLHIIVTLCTQKYELRGMP